jgi:predicted  nucleic acid-binding Zn-ribbon protein
MDTTGNHKINEEPIIDDTEVSPQYEDIYSDHEDNSMNLNIPRKRTFSVDYSEEIQDRITRANTRHHIRRNTLQEGVKDAEKIAQLEDEQNFLRDEIKELRSSLKDQMLMKQQINDLHSELIIRKTQSKSTLKNVEYESEEPTPVVSTSL